MQDIKQIKGIIFDYGGTIDTNGKHWSEVIWEAYRFYNVPVGKEPFREAYVYAERYLEQQAVIQPDYTFKDVLQAKINLQLECLKKQRFLSDLNLTDFSLAISNQSYNFVVAVLKKAKPVLEKLAARYPLVLVSNFYGNMNAVLKDFGLRSYFNEIIESSIVGIRKPNPDIFGLGVKALNLKPEEAVVIGDSYKNDISPARQIGCRTIWLKGLAWKDDKYGTADAVITDFTELEYLLLKNK